MLPTRSDPPHLLALDADNAWIASALEQVQSRQAGSRK